MILYSSDQALPMEHEEKIISLNENECNVAVISVFTKQWLMNFNGNGSSAYIRNKYIRLAEVIADYVV